MIAQGSHTSSKHSENINRVDVHNIVSKSPHLGVEFKEVESDWPHLTTAEIARRIAENRMLFMKRNAKRSQIESDYYKQKAHRSEQ